MPGSFFFLAKEAALVPVVAPSFFLAATVAAADPAVEAPFFFPIWRLRWERMK